jgi:hypothetical protein
LRLSLSGASRERNLVERRRRPLHVRAPASYGIKAICLKASPVPATADSRLFKRPSRLLQDEPRRAPRLPSRAPRARALIRTGPSIMLVTT